MAKTAEFIAKFYVERRQVNGVDVLSVIDPIDNFVLIEQATADLMIDERPRTICLPVTVDEGNRLLEQHRADIAKEEEIEIRDDEFLSVLFKEGMPVGECRQLQKIC